MDDPVILTTKTGGSISAPLRKLRTPRAILAFTLEALNRRAYRHEVIDTIQQLERHYGLELGGLSSVMSNKMKRY